MLSTKSKFAAFDIDGTLYRGNLTWDFFNQLIRREIIPSSSMEALESFYIAHDTRISDKAYSEYDKNLIEVFCKNLGNINDMSIYWSLGKQIAEQNSDRLYKYTRELLTNFKNEGYILVAITNSVGAVARPFAHALGFDIVSANDEILDSKSGHIIDWTIYSNLETKGAVLRRLTEENNLSLKGSYAIGDTKADALMLELVDNPIAFNPERELQQIALSSKWQIVVERKNVVYRLEGVEDSFILRAT